MAALRAGARRHPRSGRRPRSRHQTGGPASRGDDHRRASREPSSIRPAPPSLDRQIAATFSRRHQAMTIESMPGFRAHPGRPAARRGWRPPRLPCTGDLAAAARLVPVPPTLRRSGNMSQRTCVPWICVVPDRIFASALKVESDFRGPRPPLVDDVPLSRSTPMRGAWPKRGPSGRSLPKL